MTNTLFEKAKYSLGGIIEAREQGYVGLSIIKRPIIRANARVRLLFDSLYQRLYEVA